MPTTKKATKKAPAAKKAEAPASAVDPELAKAAKQILPKLKAGKTTLSAERDRLGLSSNGPLRKALTELLGSKAKYTAMMKAGLEARAEQQES
jgi:hypothetical protein